MPTEKNPLDFSTIPIPSAESLRRPLTDKEKREIWGDYASDISPEMLEKLAAALRECGEDEQETVQGLIRALLFRKMATRMLDRQNGLLHKSIDNFEKTTDKFNRRFK